MIYNEKCRNQVDIVKIVLRIKKVETQAASGSSIYIKEFICVLSILIDVWY